MPINETSTKSRTNFNFVIDLISFAVLSFLTTTGILMKYILPPGSGGRLRIWELDRHQWGGIHFWLAAAFFALMVLHVYLHWHWIVAVVMGRKRLGSRALAYAVAAAAIILLAVLPLLSPVRAERGGRRGEFRQEHDTSFDKAPAATELTKVKETDNESGGEGSQKHQEEAESIRGSMTLKEAEEATGVPASHIISELKLPSSVTPEDKLGRLKKDYGFEIEDVRKIVRKYQEAGRAK
jgi:hypothetical protein